MPKQPYAKPALTIADLVALLQTRGMAIQDHQRVSHYLKFIGYYRLSGYFRFFRDIAANPQRENFRAGTTFQMALDLYVFDRKMRALLLDALERIEIAVKSEISNTGALQGNGDVFWLNDPANFDHGQHGIISKMLQDRLDHSQPNIFHQFISHFFNTYTDSTAPSWMAMEAFSFGDASNIYKRMKGALRLPIAASFSVQHDILESWLHALAFARNICAHHARTWNRTFTIKPKIPKAYQGVWPSVAQDRLYVLCCIIHYMMRVVSDGSLWHEQLRALVASRPNVSLSSMGFPEEWESQTLWNFGP